MTTQHAIDLAREHIAEYLTADFGVEVCGVRAPGMGNLDSTVFTADFARQHEDGTYWVARPYPEDDEGQMIGDLADVIRYTCLHGDVDGFVDDFAEKIDAAPSDDE
jgi:hypothetical protein